MRFVDNQPDSPLAEAILRTILYADVFDFPLTDAEIHHFLIGCPTTLDDVQNTLANSAYLGERITRTGKYYAMRERDTDTIGQERERRDAASTQLWGKARRYGWLLAHLPFVRMVAITGSLSMRNAKSASDDIDYLVITTPRRVWLTRLLVVAVVRLAKLRGVWLCPNYVLAQTALAMDRADLYTAHEITQMIPLTGFEIYRALRSANLWADAYLPNAHDPFYAEADTQPRRLGRWIQRLSEVLLSGPVGDGLERWEQRRKQRKFAAQYETTPASSARLDDQQIKGHFRDHRDPTNSQYTERLITYHLNADLELPSRQITGKRASAT